MSELRSALWSFWRTPLGVVCWFFFLVILFCLLHNSYPAAVGGALLLRGLVSVCSSFVVTVANMLTSVGFGPLVLRFVRRYSALGNKEAVG